MTTESVVAAAILDRARDDVLQYAELYQVARLAGVTGSGSCSLVDVVVESVAVLLGRRFIVAGRLGTTFEGKLFVADELDASERAKSIMRDAFHALGEPPDLCGEYWIQITDLGRKACEQES